MGTEELKWMWCLIALHAGSLWGQSHTVSVRSPPGNPSTIEAQAKFFQYRHLPNTEEFNQGHRLGSERHFTERHERARPADGLFSAKVRWGDKKGGYGEHYWDLNHASHSDNHGYDGDDGSYHEPTSNNHYDDSDNNSPTYGHEEYDPEKSSYEENGRAKRAHPKTKIERKHQKHTETYDEEPVTQKQKRKHKVEEEPEIDEDEEYVDEEEEEVYVKPKPKRLKKKKQEEDQKPHEQEENDEEPKQQKTKEKKQFVLVVSQKDDPEKQTQQYQPQYTTRQPDINQYDQSDLPQYLQKPQPDLQQYLPKQQPDLQQYQTNKQPEQQQYVPYESGAGVRQYHQPEVSAATTVPRLFLEASTGHVVDRATGQAYVLQPIAAPKNYN